MSKLVYLELDSSSRYSTNVTSVSAVIEVAAAAQVIAGRRQQAACR
jgi:hypothetical protein